VLYCGIGVDEDYEFVGFEEGVEDVWFYPSVVDAVAHALRVEELVVVAVDLSCEVLAIPQCTT
jgi:hypothetical protein